MSQNNMPDRESSSRAYAQRFSGPVGSWFLAVQEEAVLKSLVASRLPAGEAGKSLEKGHSPTTTHQPLTTILDVGGGHGQLTELLLEQGAVTVLGSPGAPTDMIRSHIDDGVISYVEGDLMSLPFEDESFDLVLAFRMITHIDDHRRFVSELCRVAKKAVIIDYPPTRSFNALVPVLFPFKKLYEKDTRVFKLFRKKEIEKSFAENTFRVSWGVREFFFPMVLHRMLKSVLISRIIEWVPRFLFVTRHFGSPVVVRADKEIK